MQQSTAMPLPVGGHYTSMVAPVLLAAHVVKPIIYSLTPNVSVLRWHSCCVVYKSAWQSWKEQQHHRIIKYYRNVPKQMSPLRQEQ